jgi:prepilin-type N-terminal cleavage/methylation domain-containing protein
VNARAVQRGFTLLEVLIVLALVGMLTGSVIAFLWDLWGRRDVLMRVSADAQAGSAVVERMEFDILGGLAGDQAAGAGVKGTATTLRLLTRGVDVPVGGKGNTSGDLQASEYQFDSGALKARRWNIGGSQGELETVCDHIEALHLRYFDGKEWKESFDSLSAGTLPVAVEVALWFGTPKPAADGSAPAAPAKATAPVADSDAPVDRKVGDDALPGREPDRLRLIVIPDGPVASWRETP